MSSFEFSSSSDSDSSSDGLLTIDLLEEDFLAEFRVLDKMIEEFLLNSVSQIVKQRTKRRRRRRKTRKVSSKIGPSGTKEKPIVNKLGKAQPQAEMDKIQHNYVNVRGLKLHVAEIGTGPAVVFLHGFPEISYSWRHQMIAVAEAGFRAIAPDFRGYGLSEVPAEPEKSTFRDLVGDILAILDFLQVQKVFLVGKDFGARVGQHFALLHQDRIAAIVAMGVPFMATGPESSLDFLPKGFYLSRWREPGRAEKDFGRFDIKTVVKNIYILFAGTELQVAREDEEIMDLIDPSAPLPPWFSEEDLTNYANLYEKSGFQTALQVPYRAWLEWDGVENPKICFPALLIMGEKDYAMKFCGLREYITSGMVKGFVPDLEVSFLPEGTHFVQEQFPNKVNQLVLSFLNKHK